MSYQKHSWLNENEQGAIPINKTNLNEIETGIYNAYPVQLIAVSDTEPSECNIGDKYYNSTTKEIYVAIDTNTWSETGETPKSDIAYWVLSQNGNFGWDGTDLVSIGGGKPQVVVSDTEPSGQPTLWIDTGEISGAKSEVVNSMSGNETALAPSVQATKEYVDGTILYNNASGSNDNITLSDNINNYKYIDIYFKNNDDIHSCLRIEPTNNKKIILQCINVANVYIVIKGQTRILNNNTINLSGINYGEYSYNNGAAKYENVNNIFITKVIGYK